MQSAAKKIRLLRIIGRLNIGGPAIQAIHLQRYFSDHPEYESLLVTGKVEDYEGDMLYLADNLGVKPLSIRHLRRDLHPIEDLMAFFQLLRIVFQYRPHVIHTHTSKAGFLGRLAGALFTLTEKAHGRPGCRFVHTFHGHTFSGYFSKFAVSVFLFFECLLARFTHRIIAVSESQKRELLETYRIGTPEQYRVIPLGLDLTPFIEAHQRRDRQGAGAEASSLRIELSIPPEVPVIGIVGRVTPIKNHKMFLEITRRLSKDFQLKALVVGDGEVRTELEEAARSVPRQVGSATHHSGDRQEVGPEPRASASGSTATTVREQVIFTGWQEDMSRVYEALDILCLTSLNEGTPLAAIEALASAKPVVATDVGGVSEVVQDGISGYVVPVVEIDLFCARVKDLLLNPEKRHRFGQAGRSHVLAKYRLDNLYDNLHNLYRHLTS